MQRKIEEDLLTHRTIYLSLSLQERTTGLDEVVKDLSSFFGLTVYFWNLSLSSAEKITRSEAEYSESTSVVSQNDNNSALLTKKPKAQKFDNIIHALIDIYHREETGIYIIENIDRLVTSNTLDIFQYELLKTWIIKLAQKSRQQKDFLLILLGTIEEEWNFEEIAPLVRMPYMSGVQISTILKREFAQLRLKDSDKDNLIDKAVHILSGMSQPELIWGIDNITNSLKIDNTTKAYLEGLLEYKKQKLKNLGLNFLPKPELGEIGGMDILKQYIERLEIEFSADTKKYKIPIPQGWALAGVPGSGKSLSAKIISQKLALPMIHLPIEEVKSRGPQHLARILKLVEANAPNILYIDELDKLFPEGEKLKDEAATTLGVFLTWLQEKKAACFVLATLNRLDTLPPELIRAGRFSEVFYVGFPQPIERKQIFQLHLSKYDSRYQDKNILSQEQWRDLIDESINFTGAEIASVVEKTYKDKFFQHHKLQKEHLNQLYAKSEALIPLIKTGYTSKIENFRQQEIDYDRLHGEVSEIMATLPEIANTVDRLYGQLLDSESGKKPQNETERIQQQLTDTVKEGYVRIVQLIENHTINLTNIDAQVSYAMRDLPEIAEDLDKMYGELCHIREKISQLEVTPIEIDFETILDYTIAEIPLYERNVEKVMAIENRARKICKPVSSKDTSNLVDKNPTYWPEMTKEEVSEIIDKYSDNPRLTTSDDDRSSETSDLESIPLSEEEREDVFYWA